MRILQASHTAMRPHVPHFAENLGSQCASPIERQLQIIHFKYDDRVPSSFGGRFSRARDAEGGLLSGELNPFGAVCEADRQSKSFVEAGQRFRFLGSKIDVLKLHLLLSIPSGPSIRDLRPRLSDDTCAARSALMFEVFTARIANQHIVLQAIGAGLFDFQPCEYERRFMASFSRQSVRARIIACAGRDFPGADPLIVQVNPPLSACALASYPMTEFSLLDSAAHSRVCDKLNS